MGAPNVGKSSIVRVVSSGTPEVNDYPFTTRGVTIGHITEGGPGKDLRFQVRIGGWCGGLVGGMGMVYLTLFCFVFL